MLHSNLVALQFTYGFNSCLVGKKWMIIVRLGMGYALNTVVFFNMPSVYSRNY